jgi:D-beta-D-heptose 7-phosphate kinase/D-beta-D-heptose 1-phosphate adenosyltransferase
MNIRQNMKTIDSKLHFWKKNEKKIIFSNGCFDLLHKGHIDLLAKARSLGDVLIVGLNSDVSVKALKGDKRPIQNQKVRFNNLLKLNSVDLIIIFEEETPLNLIKKIQPNIIVKGQDYKVKHVVGYNTIKSWGGEVVLVPLTKGYSTTSIIKKNKL